MERELKQLSSDALLEKIFYYMERLFEEKELSSTLLLLTDLGRTLVNSDRASFWFWDKEQHQVWTLAALDISKIVIPEDTGLIGASILRNEVLIINDPYSDPRFNSTVDKQSGYITKSILTLPVTDTAGNVIGAYQAINKLDSEGNDAEFTEADLKRLSLATAFCGKSLESYLHYNDAQEDALTRLKNRRGLYSHYEKNIVPVLSFKKASVIMCDIDHFKQVNDTFGHNAGDAVLQQLADTFRSLVGIDDGVYRWGGEEFIILLPGKDLVLATDFAEKCRQTVEACPCEYEGNTIDITLSFGVSELDATKSMDENVADVDRKLYYAKQHGRNCVISLIAD